MNRGGGAPGIHPRHGSQVLSTPGERTVFLDIDGVLLSGRAWASPENRACEGIADPREAARGVTFDRRAVALVNRLCRETGARIAVSSNWRRRVGLDPTRAKLVEQGIDPGSFHEHWACPYRLASTKGEDISLWLGRHRPHAAPEGHLVLDDEPVHPHESRTVLVDSHRGFDRRAYREAIRLLGAAEDPAPGDRRRG